MFFNRGEGGGRHWLVHRKRRDVGEGGGRGRGVEIESTITFGGVQDTYLS